MSVRQPCAVGLFLRFQMLYLGRLQVLGGKLGSLNRSASGPAKWNDNGPMPFVDGLGDPVMPISPSVVSCDRSREPRSAKLLRLSEKGSMSFDRPLTRSEKLAMATELLLGCTALLKSDCSSDSCRES